MPVCPSIAGEWREGAFPRMIWRLRQKGDAVAGTATAERTAGCGEFQWTITGAVDSTGQFTLSASHGSPSTDACGNQPPKLSIVAVTLQYSACEGGIGSAQSWPERYELSAAKVAPYKKPSKCFGVTWAAIACPTLSRSGMCSTESSCCTFSGLISGRLQAVRLVLVSSTL